MRLMLDTSVLIEIEHRNPRILDALVNYKPREVSMSALALAEYEVGVKLGNAKKRNLATFRHLKAAYPALAFDARAGSAAAVLLAKHTLKGNQAGLFDLLIAAHANALGVTVAYCDGDFNRFAIKKQLWSDK